MRRRFMSSLGSVMLMYSTVSNNPIDFTGRDFGAKIVKHYYKDGIYHVAFNKPITQIPELTFRYTDLNYIQFSESVSHIGAYAFEECDDLVSITIPDNVSSFGNGVFKNCTNLTTVNITYNSQLTCIPTFTFDDCVNLTSITIPTNVSTVEDYAFRECNNLSSVHINSIANWCNIQFGDYSSNPLYYRPNLYLNGELITELIIPDGVTNIKDRSFLGCSHITSVTLSKSLTHIGKHTFFGCEKLESVIIPKDSQLVSINDYAFDSCLNLIEVNIGSLEEWCKILFTTSESNPLTGAERLYLNGELITELIIPENITRIGKYAFNYNTCITSIIIPSGITSIGNNAFYGCENLKTVINCSNLLVTKGGTSHGYVAYYADRVVNTDYFIDGYYFKTRDGVHYLAGYIGDDTDLTLPADYKGEDYQIEISAFYGYTNITSITIPENSKLTSIAFSAFLSCSRLTSITLNKGITNIEESAFENCSRLAYINIPENSQLTSIGDWAFQNCSSLTTITIPEGVTSIGSYTFNNCSSLTSVHISSLEAWCNIDFSSPESNPLSSAKNLYLNGELVTELTIPNSVTTIKYCAFYGCSSLTSITIPESVTSIGYYAFYKCSLTSITCEAATPPTIGNSDTFYRIDKSIPVYVPANSVEAYKSASYWSEFTNIQAVFE